MNPVTLFKCLADESRLRLMVLLSMVDEACVCDLMQALGQDQPKTSRQLSDLRKCGMLADERRGKWVYYRLAPELPDWARAIVTQVAEGHPDTYTPSLQTLKASINSTQACQR